MKAIVDGGCEKDASNCSNNVVREEAWGMRSAERSKVNVL